LGSSAAFAPEEARFTGERYRAGQPCASEAKSRDEHSEGEQPAKKCARALR